LDAAHQVGGEAGDFVSKALGGNDSLCNWMRILSPGRVVAGTAHHFVDDSLIGVEIIGEAGVALKS